MSERAHELTIRDEVVLRDIELLHVDSRVLGVFHGLLGGCRGATCRHELRIARSALVLLFFFLLPLALLVRLLQRLLPDGRHDEVEVALSLAVSDLIEHDLRLDGDSGRFTDEYALQALKHLKDVDWVHASVLIMIAQLKHNCRPTERQREVSIELSRLN